MKMRSAGREDGFLLTSDAKCEDYAIVELQPAYPYML